jgi:hypothetical protein
MSVNGSVSGSSQASAEDGGHRSGDLAFDAALSEAYDVDALFGHGSPRAGCLQASGAERAASSPIAASPPERAPVSPGCSSQQRATGCWDLASSSSESCAGPEAQRTSREPAELPAASLTPARSSAVQDGRCACPGQPRPPSRSRSPVRSSPSPGRARRPTLGELANQIPEPEPLRGAEHWQAPLWRSFETMRMRLPVRPSRPMLHEGLCAGTAAELLGFQDLWPGQQRFPVRCVCVSVHRDLTFSCLKSLCCRSQNPCKS